MIDVPEWFSQPDKAEPLNQFVAEAIEALVARESEKPCVVVAPDSLLTTVPDYVVNGEVNMDALVRSMTERLGFEHVESGGWSVWRPRDLQWSEACQGNRKVLTQFISEVKKNGPQLRSYCAMFARASEFPLGLSKSGNGPCANADTWVSTAAGYTSLARWDT